MRRSEPVSPDLSTPGTGPQIPWRGLSLLLSLMAGLFVLSQTFVIVQAGERAVVFSDLSGVQNYQLTEGFHLNLPLVWHITKYDIKTRTYTMSGSAQESGRLAESRSESEQVPDDSLTALTSDGLPVTLDLSIRFHVDPDNVWRLHKQIGPDFIDRAVRPQARSIARMTFAGFPVIDVYSGKRQAIVDEISTQLREKFKQNYLVLDEVLLRDIRFPPEFQATIEQKQVAQQATEQMVYELQRAALEKQQKIVQAQGEPEMRSHTRIAIAEFPADRVYSAEQVAIQTNLETRLREKLAHNYIQVDEVLLRAITFSDAYQNAIIQKQISQQNAQRMQYVLAKEQQEKRRKIILAEGEAESIQMKGQAIATNPRVVAYQYVQKLAPNIKTILSSGNVPLPTVGTDTP